MKRFLIIIALLANMAVHASDATVYQYRIYCITEAQNVYTWGTTTPTVCPNSAAHVINPLSISIVNELSQNIVKVQEETVITGGYFKAETVTINAATGPGVVTSATQSWPYDVSILGLYCQTDDDQNGDVLTIEAATDVTVGILTADLASTSTQANVTSTVVQNAWKGFYLTLTDGTNTDTCGRIIDIDTVNNVIAFETPTVHDFAAATPTAVQITVRPVENFTFGPAGKYEIGARAIGGSHLPANQVATFYYTNNGATAKTVSIGYEYFY